MNLRVLVPSLILAAGIPAVAVEVRVDVSRNLNARPYVQPVKALFEEWYPKINGILFDKGTPLPFENIQVVFERMIVDGGTPDKHEVPAYAEGNAVHVNFAYLGHMPDDYQAMLIHELAHVNQQYRENKDAGWLVEGIADYVRHKYFEKDIEAKLAFNGDVATDKAKLAKEGYLFGYTVTSPFLYWLEVKKDKEIVRVLNLALRNGTYSPEVFKQHCGAPLAALWAEFMAQSKP